MRKGTCKSIRTKLSERFVMAIRQTIYGPDGFPQSSITYLLAIPKIASGAILKQSEFDTFVQFPDYVLVIYLVFHLNTILY